MAIEQTNPTEANQLNAAATSETKPHCGIIMPISDTPGYDPGHWIQVRDLIIRAAEKAGFTATMVSENEGQDMIHASIIKNIYHNPVVVCDVSSLNPNVMLELGLRMATKKPLVLVFDSADNYPFDIKNFIYEEYPKGLHFFKVEKFVTSLAAKIKQVYDNEQQGTYQPYLSHFNDVIIETSKLDTSTQTVTETLLGLVSDVKELKADLQNIQPKHRVQPGTRQNNSAGTISATEMTLISKILDDLISNNHGKLTYRDWDRLLTLIQNEYTQKFASIGRPVSEIEHRLEIIRPALEGMITARIPA